MPNLENLAKGCIGRPGAKTGATVVDAAQIPTQYIHAKDGTWVQRDSTMVDVKMRPTFTIKQTSSCIGDVLHDTP